jgi:N-acetylmuramoyl-L-alanine amidase
VLALIAAVVLTPTVCIDPGHPSEVGRGTTGKRISELRAAWLVALKMRHRLEARGVRVVLTKDSETQFVKNRDRSRIANEAKADLMVRLHCDAASGSGFTTYYPDRQGRSNGRTGPSQAVLDDTALLAKPFHETLGRLLRGVLKDNGLKPDVKTSVGAKQGALTGSIFSEVPVVLVEMVVLTNPKDEAFMASSKGQSQMAEALTQATISALARAGKAES